jgi:membrane protein DedA with SNARE-associated domain
MMPECTGDSIPRRGRRNRDEVHVTAAFAAATAAAALSIASSFNAAADWAANYGYPGIFLIVAGDGVFPVLPGETAVITGAVFAASGKLTLLLVILAGALGAILGDSTAYWVGRAGGQRIRSGLMRMAGKERIEAGERMVRRRGPALVFVGRFLPGLRLAVNLACGAGGMDFRRFLLFDSMGAVVWSTQAALLGYFAGKAFADQLWIALLIALGVAMVVAGVVAVKERQISRREREAG